MTNQERIKKYLVGENGYLKSDISNGKVIMLSGKWGSGKTHFWQNDIATDILKEKLKKKREVYSYVSLYGKTSIEEIENDIFSQAYSSAIGGENFVTKGFSTFTKGMRRFGSSKIANGLKEEQQENIERTALSRLNNDGIICFDDFERKSKEIDLNDLFGFITQLSLNFQCKVVIILNDDVFEGKEKDIFSNVKEKTVSKYLNYNPEIKELFEIIFDDKRYSLLYDYKNVILETILKTKELNARIYIQVLDNLLEYKDKRKDLIGEERFIKYLIFTNINFILNHKVFEVQLNDVDINLGSNILSLASENKSYSKTPKYENMIVINVKSEFEIIKEVSNYFSPIDYDKNYINKLINKIEIEENKNESKQTGVNNSKILVDWINDNKNLVKSAHYLSSLKINTLVESNNKDAKDILNEINDFIETGILINNG